MDRNYFTSLVVIKKLLIKDYFRKWGGKFGKLIQKQGVWGILFACF